MKFRELAGSLAALTAGILLVGSVGSRIQAQGSITVSFSNFGNASWPAGPDFATDVLGDPWDFCNADDVAPDPGELIGWSSFSVNTGACVAGGTTAKVNSVVDTQMSILFRGRYGILNPDRTGRQFPIDPGRYQKLSYRMSDSVASGDGGRVNWFHYAWEDPANNTGDPNGGGMAWAPANVLGYYTYVMDLTQPQAAGLSWTNGLVRGLRLSPNTTQAPSDVYYKWVRLTTADNAPGSAMQTISFSSGSGSRVEVWDAANTTLILTITASTGGSSIPWNYGVLPPGSYTMRVTKSGVTGSKAFTINTPPVINLIEPNATGSADYATTVLGNAWDMNSASDVQLTGFDNYTPTPATFSGGIMTATNTNGDPNVTLLNSANSAVPIDSSRYRFFTVRMSIDDPNNTREWGVARIFWTSQQYLDGNTATGTKDIDVWPGMHTYTVDLAPLTTAPDGGLEPGSVGQTWTSANMRNFRFDPSEYPDPRPFHIDYVKLAAMAEPTNDSFTIKWTSMGNPNSSVTLYADTDTNPTNGKILIASGVTMGNGQYVWATSGVAAGDYWIYAETSDGIQTYGRYSTGQVRIGGMSAPVSTPQMAVDTPAPNATALQPFAVSGWALDRGATAGTGVDAVHVWAYPMVGGSPIFVGGATLGGSRLDIGQLFGSQFTNSGFTLNVSTLAAGSYNLFVTAHSTVTGTFNQSKTLPITVNVVPPAMALDAPVNGSVTGPSFTASGWAIDATAPFGTGVNEVDLWAFPAGGGAAKFLGLATYGLSRPDIGSLYGSRFTNSGFSLAVGGLTAGITYNVVAYAKSTATGTFNNSRASTVAVSGPVSSVAIAVDAPANGSTPSLPMTVSGWAIDRGATSGTGVSGVHVWAFPVGGGTARWLGSASYGISRPDIGMLYGSSFTNSGYSLNVNASTGLVSGRQYDLVVYAYSTLTGSFSPSGAVRVTIK